MINDEQRKMIQQEVLTALGSCPPLDMIQDNDEYIRFDEREKRRGNQNCWLRVFPYTTRLYWTRGNNRLGKNGVWGHASETGESKRWTAAEWEEFRLQEQKRKEQKEREQQKELQKLRTWFKSLPTYGEEREGFKRDGFKFYPHSYLEAKRLEFSRKAAQVAKVYYEQTGYVDKRSFIPNNRRNPYLVFPILGSSGLLESVQIIDNWKNEKHFKSGLPLSGRFYPLLESDSKRNLIFACEGFATGLSIFEATNRVTIVCLNCGNLPKGIQGATTYLLNYWKLKETPREFYRRFVIVADNDRSRAGEDAAIEACNELGCSYVLIPDEGMDANDFHHKYGLKALGQILNF